MNSENTDETFDQMMRNADLDARLARLSARADRSRPAAASAARDTNGAKGSTGSKRRSAARGSRRTALGLSAVTTLGLAGWMYSAAGTTTTNLSSISASGAADSTAATTATTAASTATTSRSTTASTTATTAPSASSAATSAGTSTSMKDGTYTGTSSTTRWGPVQVQITVSGGRITAVNVLSYPRNDNKSASINATAVPRLVQSTLSAQSASISSVSGATYTSAGYKTSLQSAIDASRAAG